MEKLLKKILWVMIFSLFVTAIASYASVTYYTQEDMDNALSSDQMLGSYVQRDSPALTKPIITAVATTTAGTMLGTTTLYFKVTSLDYAGGETIASAESSCALGAYLTGAPDGCIVASTLPSGSASSKLWVATTTGVYYGYITATSSTLVATTTSVLTLGTLPQTNTAFLFNSGQNIPNTYLYKTVTADALVKSGETIVHSITFSPTDAAVTAGSISLLDSTSYGSGTTTTYYFTAAYHEANTIILDAIYPNGLYVDFDTTADVNVNITYK
jgi:hypothetical protein